MLASFQTKISFIFNIGSKGVGKSFTLNQALDLDVWGVSFKADQIGIKIWLQPFYKQEDNMSVFFVDCSGFQ